MEAEKEKEDHHDNEMCGVPGLMNHRTTVAYGGKVVSPRMLELTRENRAKDISTKRRTWRELSPPINMLQAKRLERQHLTHRATGPYKLGTKCLIPSLSSHQL